MSVLKDLTGCLWECSLGFKAPTYVDSRGSFALDYGMERMAGDDGIEWESAKLEPLGSRTEGSMPANIKKKQKINTGNAAEEEHNEHQE